MAPQSATSTMSLMMVRVFLFEIATSEPGFTVDEPLPELGRSLKLPPQHEPLRAQLERILPPLEL